MAGRVGATGKLVLEKALRVHQGLLAAGRE